MQMVQSSRTKYLDRAMERRRRPDHLTGNYDAAFITYSTDTAKLFISQDRDLLGRKRQELGDLLSGRTTNEVKLQLHSLSMHGSDRNKAVSSR
jgi:hypothetical protein